MSLLEQIKQDTKDAMRAKDKLKLSVLRMISSAVSYELLNKSDAEENDALVMSVLKKQQKQRVDAIEGAKKAGREDLAEKEAQEKEIIDTYLPKPLSDEELSAVIKEIIAETGAESKRDMGKVIKAVIAKTGGAADGKKVSSIVADLLS